MVKPVKCCEGAARSAAQLSRHHPQAQRCSPSELDGVFACVLIALALTE